MCDNCHLSFRPAFLRSIKFSVGLLGLLAGSCLFACDAEAQDVVEFLSGSRLEGKVTEIRKEAKEFDFAAKIGSRVTRRTYAFSTVHAVTLNGKRHVLTPVESAPVGGGGPASGGPASGGPASGGPASGGPASGGPASGGGGAEVTRSPAEINRIIEQAGTTPPDWYDSAALEYPDSLDLSWPLKPDGDWNNQKNMGQYIWDIVNPNPHRWRPGIKLVHHCITLHANQPALLQRDMAKLGNMYFQLLQDYPRAAFWLRKAGGGATPLDRVILAECYWRLGSKPMALEMLRTRTLPVQAIKLLGDLGETGRAVQLAMAAGKTTQAPEAFLLAGDALRLAGQQQRAIEFYERVLASDKHRNEEYAAMHKARARESIEAVKLFDQLDITRVADGTYTGVSTGYNGAVTIAVEVRNARLESVEVTDHQEKQFYSALTDTPRRLIRQQSVQEVDAVSGATITSQAIVNATARALADGNR